MASEPVEPENSEKRSDIGEVRCVITSHLQLNSLLFQVRIPAEITSFVDSVADIITERIEHHPTSKMIVHNFPHEYIWILVSS